MCILYIYTYMCVCASDVNLCLFPSVSNSLHLSARPHPTRHATSSPAARATYIYIYICIFIYIYTYARVCVRLTQPLCLPASQTLRLSLYNPIRCGTRPRTERYVPPPRLRAGRAGAGLRARDFTRRRRVGLRAAAPLEEDRRRHSGRRVAVFGLRQGGNPSGEREKKRERDYMYVYVYIYIYMSICLSIYLSIYLYTYITHIYIHTYTYIYTHIYRLPSSRCDARRSWETRWRPTRGCFRSLLKRPSAR